jgi:uncharacterized repeat protein (TIGR03803 family)
MLQGLPTMKWKLTFVAIAITVLTLPGGSAVRERVYNLQYRQGVRPYAGLIQDGAGNLYGTATRGGQKGYGSVFEFVPAANGGPTRKALYSFLGGADGAEPEAPLLFDAAGNLYGTTYRGGGGEEGTVFQLHPDGAGQWTENVIHTFLSGSDGGFPMAGLAIDGAGNLYGTTRTGGDPHCQCGAVYELTPQQNGQWSETTIHAFTGGNDGSDPEAGLTFDQSGNLYGTTSQSNFGGFGGTAFELTPAGNGAWNETVLHEFIGSPDGAGPEGGVTFDGSGNIYGTTVSGGLAECGEGSGCGTVYELSPNAGGWAESILYFFAGGSSGDVFSPGGNLIFDDFGNLYGTAQQSESNGPGGLFRLHPGANGQWSANRFILTAGRTPLGGVILATPRDLVGTTGYGGIGDNGVIFDLTTDTFNR